MKNLYMFQVNYSYGRSAHLPYTAAALVSYAMAEPRVASEYNLCDIFFLRDEPDAIIKRMKEPAFVGFSTYIWNYEFNKKTAKKIKELYPECVIVFGGHHVAPGDALLEECPYIDYLIHGEGEEAFMRLLLSAAGMDDATSVPGVSYRKDGKPFTNEAALLSGEYIDYPSPYLGGYFDKILKENPDMDFMALIETTRGCPNSCSYCDWSNMKSRIRKFPMKRVLDEIRWISEHRILGLGSADSNFGLLERDEEITDFLIEVYLRNGYPSAFQTSYAKNSNERIFRIGCKLDKYGLSKGITLSFQSMSDVVLRNIGRHNIPVSHYSSLMKLYNNAGVATYTELILGLPGETYDSFADGIDTLLNLGQHSSLYIHNCEWLPCSTMGKPEYVRRFDIKTSLIPLNQPHVVGEPDSISERSRLVTSTCSMPAGDWVRMNIFSFTVQCFHHMGLLEFFALHLHNAEGLGYRSFYESFIRWAHGAKGTVANRIYSDVEERLNRIVSGDSSAEFVAADSRFGEVRWPFEEYMYLCTVYELNDFYREVGDFLSQYGIDGELLRFQREMVKLPFESEKQLHYEHDWLTYFRQLLKNIPAELHESSCGVSIRAKYIDSWENYAKNIVWYGRKNSRNVFINEAVETD